MKKLAAIIVANLILFSIFATTDPTPKVTTDKKATAKNQTSTKKAKKAAKDSTAVKEEKHRCIYITKADFLQKIDNFEKDAQVWKYLGDKPCIIDFYTTWCGPCRQLAPVMEELAKEYEGQIYIYKADAEKEIDLARVFQVQAYPTLVFCPMTGNPQIAKGALPKAELKGIIEQVLIKTQAPPPPPLLKRR